jgi:hypothetical protein
MNGCPAIREVLATTVPSLRESSGRKLGRDWLRRKRSFPLGSLMVLVIPAPNFHLALILPQGGQQNNR